ncbi:MAG: NERD domain-containing protein [Spirochaetales bacterium]|nr:NERD domain-containing protein [Spirochaetales bacterium]
MAIMYPSVINQEFVESQAELFLYNELQRQLDDSFHVFHSMTWTGNRNIQGECDFIIFKKDMGFIALEVKGGSIEVIDNTWYSINRFQQRIKVKDPVKQARYAQYAFRDLYRATFQEYFAGIFSWGVCFPESKIRDDFHHRELNQKNILHLGNIDRIYHWVVDLFNFTRPNHMRKLTEQQAQNFLSLFNTNLRFTRSILFSMKKQEEELEVVDHFQEYMLNLFDDKKRVGFQGAAGTGKTWIALKKVMRLADEGKRILFLCFSSNLKNYIARKLSGIATVTVETFHSFAIKVLADFITAIVSSQHIEQDFTSFIKKLYLAAGEIEYYEEDDYLGFLRWISTIGVIDDCRGILENSRVRFEETLYSVMHELVCNEGGRDFYSDKLPSALGIIFNEYTLKDQFDAIVIDEAQDFEDKWCDCINYFYRNQQDRVIYIFYDDNQSIFRKNETLPVVGLLNTSQLGDYIFHLKNNVRNTSAIHRFAIAKTGLGSTAQPMDIEGIDPEEYTFTSRQEARDHVAAIAQQLLEDHGLNRSGITVLSNASFETSLFRDSGMLAGYRLEPEIKTHSKGIRYRTISQFKGLESDVVLLILDYTSSDEEEHHSITPELVYVGCTRAKYVLYVFNIMPGK